MGVNGGGSGIRGLSETGPNGGSPSAVDDRQAWKPGRAKQEGKKSNGKKEEKQEKTEVIQSKS
jgi:hypothetical protein